jgi:nucleoside-diphosphate-sugar epimerase
MRILVTGAAGRLAQYLIPLLLQRGYALNFLDYNAERVRENFKKQLAFLEPGEDGIAAPTKARLFQANLAKGDPDDLAQIDAACAGCDCVVHLAALVDYLAPRKRVFAVNVEGTRRVLDAAKRAGVKRFVFASSTSVYRSPRYLPIDEKHPIAASNAYGQSKAEAEKLVRASGLPYVILRFALVYGPGFEEGFRSVAEKIKDGAMVLIGSGENRIAFVHASDAAQAVVLAIEKREAVNRDFIIASDEEVTQEQALAAIADAFGVKPPEKRVFKWLAYSGAQWSVFKRKIGLSSTAFTPENIGTLAEDRWYDVTKARTVLGFEAKVRFEDGLHEFVSSLEKKT